jgi:hypothetical protein
VKILLLLSILFLAACQTRIEEQTIAYAGKQKMGDGVHIMKFYVGDDRVYILVDDSCNPITESISVNQTISSGKSAHVETNTTFGRFHK